ncbi:MAG: hypothetical protein KAS63_10265 [Candidatus Heimdallarchaeota archaeon]|nr:hypothetical protein [Candidatus Heimdallarchaeota archaeon]MCK4955737.1 hypothetical protein [Candidatus Heimdallarchaeota archaeon]
MSSRKLPADIYKNLKKLELSANTKSGTMEETITLERKSEDEDPRPNYWFVIMLSFGQRSGYVYDRSGLHIPEPDAYFYSVELWKFKGSSLKGVETVSNKVDFDQAVKEFQEQKNDLLSKGFQIIH